MADNNNINKDSLLVLLSAKRKPTTIKLIIYLGVGKLFPLVGKLFPIVG